ncbi:MAG: FAD binding domain-containing protein [Proteobacteria bacterium]|nr:FAD binding domain-containing protein [Pseudomonadota bacterium]
MKAAAFEYSRPETLEEACAILSGAQGARVIAGGQSLVPLMAMRLERPARLVDVARIAELSFIREEADAVIVGAATRQCVIEANRVIAVRVPLLSRAMPHVGPAATRARGTIGGSLANADAAAEIVLVAVTLGAQMTHRRDTRLRESGAAAFFTAPGITTLPERSCLTAVRFPAWPEPGLGAGFHEIGVRADDFPLLAAAAQIALDAQGRARRVAIGVGGLAATPLRLDALAHALIGRHAEPTAIGDIVTEALAAVEPLDDMRASGAYRRRAAATLVTRALGDAAAAAATAGRRGDDAR